MVCEGKGRLFKRKNPDRYLIYLPKKLAEDSMFPFKLHSSIIVKISFEPEGKQLCVMEWSNSKPSTN